MPTLRDDDEGRLKVYRRTEERVDKSEHEVRGDVPGPEIDDADERFAGG
jgi:hypothetical protein